MLPADAVFEGGGVRAIAFVGAVAAFEEAGYRWQLLAGTSAGALVAALMAAGYRAAEMRSLLEQTDLTQFAVRQGIARLPLAGPVISFIGSLGVYSADGLEQWLAARLAERGVRTFGDLVADEKATESRFRYRLHVVASDVTRRRLLLLPDDAGQIGQTPDTLPVALAVRMSASIPIYYTPVRVRPRPESGEILIVDGGLLSNFPVWVFDVPGEPPWPTFGFRLVSSSEDPALETAGPPTPIGYLNALLDTLLSAGVTRDLAAADRVRTVDIPTSGVRTTQFDLPADLRQKLYEAGYQAARAFLEKWDFDKYVADYRSTGSKGDRPREAAS